MSQTYYKQCTYKQSNGLTETAWLPENLAVVGKKIYFGKKTKTPDQLWEIVVVSDGRLSESYLLNHERDYKTQRQAWIFEMSKSIRIPDFMPATTQIDPKIKIGNLYKTVEIWDCDILNNDDNERVRIPALEIVLLLDIKDENFVKTTCSVKLLYENKILYRDVILKHAVNELKPVIIE